MKTPLVTNFPIRKNLEDDFELRQPTMFQRILCGYKPWTRIHCVWDPIRNGSVIWFGKLTYDRLLYAFETAKNYRTKII